MRALILAGGLGTRLRPITDNTPKCLVKIKNRPLLDYWLEKLTDAGIKKILINTHWLSNKVEDFICNSKWSKFVDLIHEKQLLGTGGTLSSNYKYFENEEILVLHADNYSKVNLNDFIYKHKNRPNNCKITLLSFITDDPSSCGIIKTNKKNIVTEFHEKVKNPPGNVANGAVYIFENNVISSLITKKNKIKEITTDLIPKYLGRIYNVTTNYYHRDIGNLKSYSQCKIDINKMEI